MIIMLFSQNLRNSALRSKEDLLNGETSVINIVMWEKPKFEKIMPYFCLGE